MTQHQQLEALDASPRPRVTRTASSTRKPPYRAANNTQMIMPNPTNTAGQVLEPHKLLDDLGHERNGTFG